jgi:hypothetical protein
MYMNVAIVRRLYRRVPGPPDRDDILNVKKSSLSKATTSFSGSHNPRKPERFSFQVHMLQTCHQINKEAAPILYGMNVFVFEATSCLYTSLSHLVHRLPLIRKIGIAHHSYTISLLGLATSIMYILHTVFPFLVQATSLEAFYLNNSIWQSFSSKPRQAATNFYYQAHLWLLAMAQQKRDALSVIKLPKLATKKLVNPPWSTNKEGQDEFMAKLGALLAVPARAEA